MHALLTPAAFVSRIASPPKPVHPPSHPPAPPSPPPSPSHPPPWQNAILIDAKRPDKWYTGQPDLTKGPAKLPYEIAQEKNVIPYDEDVAVWHWTHRNRPIRCAVDLTVYRNTTSNGITVRCVAVTACAEATRFVDCSVCLLAGYGLGPRVRDVLQGRVRRDRRQRGHQLRGALSM